MGLGWQKDGVHDPVGGGLVAENAYYLHHFKPAMTPNVVQHVHHDSPCLDLKLKF